MYMLFVFIYVYWCPKRYLFQMMLSFSNNTTVVTCGVGTTKPSEF